MVHLTKTAKLRLGMDLDLPASRRDSSGQHAAAARAPSQPGSKAKSPGPLGSTISVSQKRSTVRPFDSARFSVRDVSRKHATSGTGATGGSKSIMAEGVARPPRSSGCAKSVPPPVARIQIASSTPAIRTPGLKFGTATCSVSDYRQKLRSTSSSARIAVTKPLTTSTAR